MLPVPNHSTTLRQDDVITPVWTGADSAGTLSGTQNDGGGKSEGKSSFPPSLSPSLFKSSSHCPASFSVSPFHNHPRTGKGFPLLSVLSYAKPYDGSLEFPSP